MFEFAVVLVYLLIGLYSALKNEPWWWEQLGSLMKHVYIEPGGSCGDKHRVEDHFRSGWAAFGFSGILWPLFPFIRQAMKRRKKEKTKLDEKAKRKAEREAELKEVEKEMEKEEKRGPIITPRP
jgi:hypothetical protein